MKNSTTIILILLSLLSLSLVSDKPIMVKSQTIIATNATLTVDRNPVGVGQAVVFNGLIQPPSPSSGDVYQNLTLSITSPNGFIERLGPFSSSDGWFFAMYVPVNIGNYTVVFTFPGVSFVNNSSYYSPSSSKPIILNVQTNPVPPIATPPARPPPAQNWDTVQVSTPHIAPYGLISMTYDGSKIAFGANVNGKSQIFLVNPDGTGLKQLISDPRAYSYPCISGNGRKIACMSYQQNTLPDGYSWATDIKLVIANSDGTGLTSLLSDSNSLRLNLLKPVISNDGSKLAFLGSVPISNTTYPSYNLTLYSINSDGTGLTTLASNLTNSGNLPAPSMSGDGAKIAFSAANVNGGQSIFVVNSDGTGLTELAPNKSPSQYDFWMYPKISDDRSKITFSSCTNDNYQIFVVNTDGTGLTQITRNAVDNGYPSITGDGEKIVFHSYVYDQSGNRQEAVLLMNSDGTALELLTTQVSFFYAVISGDGNKIAYFDNSPEENLLFVSSKVESGSRNTQTTTPTSSPLSSTTSSNSATPTPADPTPTNQTPLDQTPTVPEFSPLAILSFIVVSCIAVVLSRKKLSFRETRNFLNKP